MSQYELHRAALEAVAQNICDAVDEQGYTVDAAMDANPSFSSSLARTLLFRDIVLDAASVAASQSGHLDFRPVNGSGRELRAIVGNVDRRYRIKRASEIEDEWQIRANSDSALASIYDPDEDETFFGYTEQWVLGWGLDQHEKVVEVFSARVLGTTAGKPAWLVLGERQFLLGGPTGHGGAFHPTDDGTLPGFGSQNAGKEEGDVGS